MQLQFNTGRKTSDLTPLVFPKDMAGNPNDDTEPHVQQLVIGSYRETGMGPQGLAGVGFCVYTPLTPATKLFFVKKA